MTPKDALEKAAEAYTPDNEHPVCRQERRAFKAGANWQAEQFKEVLKAKSDIYIDGIEIAEEERDQWKSEYQNLCKFANDYEEQRDAWKKQAEALAEALSQIKEKSISDLPLGTWMFWRAIASEALKAFEEFKKSGK